MREKQIIFGKICFLVHLNFETGEYSMHSYLPLGKMATNLADDIFTYNFINAKFCISIRISLKFVPGSLVDNKSTSVGYMAWRRTGDKQLLEPTLTQFTDTYIEQSCLSCSWYWKNPPWSFHIFTFKTLPRVKDPGSKYLISKTEDYKDLL